MGYKFSIEYKSGTANKVVDTLSRRDEEVDADAALLTAFAHPMLDIVQLLREETAVAEDLCALRSQIDAGTAATSATILMAFHILCTRLMFLFFFVKK